MPGEAEADTDGHLWPIAVSRLPAAAETSRSALTVADTHGLDFPFCTPSQQAEEVAYLRAHGYAQVYADHGYVVLHRPADARTAQALAHPLPAARLHTDICY